MGLLPAQLLGGTGADWESFHCRSQGLLLFQRVSENSREMIVPDLSLEWRFLQKQTHFWGEVS